MERDLLLAATLYMSRYTKILRVFGKEAEDAFDPSVGPEELAALYGDAAEAIVGTVRASVGGTTEVAERVTREVIPAVRSLAEELRLLDESLDPSILKLQEYMGESADFWEFIADRYSDTFARLEQNESAFFTASQDRRAKSFAEAGKLYAQFLTNEIRGRLLEAVAGAVARALKTVPFPFNIALAGAAAIGTTTAFNALVNKIGIPSFRGGVTGFGGGLAQVHQDEIVQLPRGSNVVSQARSRNIADTLAGQGGMSGTIKVQIKADVPFVMDKMQFESERNGRTGAGPVIMFEQ